MADARLVRHELTDEAIALLSLSLTALVDASAVYPSVIKTDLHACILHIFATILATPSCQATVVPQALPIMKRFLSTITAAPQPETHTQLRSALTRFLAVLKKAQQREFDAAEQCEKNALLACTVLLSSSNGSFTADDILLERFNAELIDCLENRIPSKVAASCVRSLLLIPKKTATDEALSAMLLPPLISFITQPVESEGLEESRVLVTSSLVSFVQTVAKDKVPVAMAFVLPTLLARATNEGRESYREVATRVLELASAQPSAFRESVGAFEGEQRTFLEEVLREGGPRRDVKSEESGGEPSIALKMAF